MHAALPVRPPDPGLPVGRGGHAEPGRPVEAAGTARLKPTLHYCLSGTLSPTVTTVSMGIIHVIHLVICVHLRDLARFFYIFRRSRLWISMIGAALKQNMLYSFWKTNMEFEY